MITYNFKDLENESMQVFSELDKLFEEIEVLKNAENKNSSTKENNINKDKIINLVEGL